MNDRCARVTYLLALLPLICTAWSVTVVYDTSEQAAGIVVMILGLVVAAWIWRRYVRWTVLRSLSALGLTGAVLLQVIWWEPAFGVSGCVQDELCTSQCSLCLGVWIAGSALLWWGSVLVGRKRTERRGGFRSLTMTRNAVRLVIAIALVPFLPGLFFFTYFLVDDYLSLPWSWSGEAWLCYTLCAGVALLVWLMLWRKSIPRSAGRIALTCVLGALLMVSPLCLYPADNWPFGPGFGEAFRAFLYLAPLFAWALWLAGTAWLWRTAEANAVDVVGLSVETRLPEVLCPQCAYSLRGLREVRCPECGWASTVDQIVAATLRATSDDV